MECLSRHGLALSPLSLEATLERGFEAKGTHKVSALTLHEDLEGKVAASSALRELALEAFQAFLRAYSIHAGELKAAFAVRSLHLGHVARSFALKDAPRSVRQAVSKPVDRAPKRARPEAEKGATEEGAKKKATKSMGYEVAMSASGV